eukprot:354192-Prorocentrum_minimum.AAC.1
MRFALNLYIDRSRGGLKGEPTSRDASSARSKRSCFHPPAPLRRTTGTAPAAPPRTYDGIGRGHKPWLGRAFTSIEATPSK